jgi:hypothetical protein
MANLPLGEAGAGVLVNQTSHHRAGCGRECHHVVELLSVFGCTREVAGCHDLVLQADLQGPMLGCEM